MSSSHALPADAGGEVFRNARPPEAIGDEGVAADGRGTIEFAS
jgi:hypothetical protein